MMGLPAVFDRGDHDADDRAAVTRIAAGDQEAFARVLEAHLDMVVGAARRMIGNGADAEEIAQETFLRLWRQAETLSVQPRVVLGAWLRRVATNLAIDRLRVARRIEPSAAPPEMAESPTQFRGLAASDATGRILEAMDALPDRQRVAITLFHFEDASQREVAEQMGITENALEALLARGRRRLKVLLADEWQALLVDLAENRND